MRALEEEATSTGAGCVLLAAPPCALRSRWTRLEEKSQRALRCHDPATRDIMDPEKQVADSANLTRRSPLLAQGVSASASNLLVFSRNLVVL